MAFPDYAYALVFLIGGVVFGVVTLSLSRWIAPQRPSKVKQSTYESGMVPVGDAWIQFKASYYIFALLFVIFDVESAFIIPWAVLFKKFVTNELMVHYGLGSFALFEMSVFIGVLAVGLIYAWAKGVLRWD